MPKGACSAFLFFGAFISISALIFGGSGWTPSLKITSPNNSIDVHLKWHLSLFNFKLTSLHHLQTLWTASLWSALSWLYPITKMSSLMPKAFGMSPKISSILHWNISPTGAAPNDNCLYQYLPNGHANVVRYDDLVSNCRLWYPELAPIIDMYFKLSSVGSISFNVGPLWMGLISAWFSLTRSKYSLTLLFALGTNTKQLHHSVILSILRGAMMSILYSCSSSSLNGFCNAYTTCLGVIWYSLLSGLSCKENVPSKHPIPLNTFSNVLWTSCVSSTLFLYLLQDWEMRENSYFVCIILVILTIGTVFAFWIWVCVCTAILPHMYFFCTLLPQPV